MWIRKVRLLLWKNMVLRGRHECITACEILTPTFVFLFLVYINTVGTGAFSIGQRAYLQKKYFNGSNGGQVIYRSLGRTGADGSTSIDDLMKDFRYYGLAKNCTNVIGFSPGDSPSAILVKERLEAEIRAGTDEFNVTLRSFSDEEKMVSAYEASLPRRYFFGRDQFVGAIVFEKGLSGDKVEKEVSYKIRPNSDKINTSNLKHIKNDHNPLKSYSESGVLAIQPILDKILIGEMTKNVADIDDKINLNKTKISLRNYPIPETEIATPTPSPYNWREAEENQRKSRDDEKRMTYSLIFSMTIALSFLFIVPTVVKEVVSEKETGIKELTKMAGLSEWMHWLGWLCNSLCVLPITVTIITICLCFAFTSHKYTTAMLCHSDKFLIWVILLLHGTWATTYCFLISSFFENPALATTYGILLWLISAGGIATGMESFLRDHSIGMKVLFCFIPNVPMQLALSVITKLELVGDGAQWSNLYQEFEEEKFVPLGITMIMMVVTAIVNVLVCLYVEAVMPRKFGVRKAPWFLFMPSEWSCCKSKNRVIPVAIPPALANQTEKENEVSSESMKNLSDNKIEEDAPSDNKNMNKEPSNVAVAEKSGTALAVPVPISSAYESGPGFEEEPKGMRPGVQSNI